jgi:hypothetical protein
MSKDKGKETDATEEAERARPRVPHASAIIFAAVIRV